MDNKLTSYLAVLCAVGLLASTASATLIAQYHFDPGAGFLLDSSGNGYDLTGTGASQDTGNYVSGGGSAYFGGSSGLQTVKPIDYSGVVNLRVSFDLQSASDSALAIILESSLNVSSSDGLWSFDVNESGSNTGLAVMHFPGYNIFNIDKVFTSVTSWHHYQLDFLSGSSIAADVVQVRIDGVLQPDVPEYSLHLTGSPGFQNETLFVGARNLITDVLTGNIDNLTIESVPEPSSIVLLVLGGAMLWHGRKLRRK